MNRETLDRELEGMIGNVGDKVPGLGVIIYAGGEEVYSKFVGRRRINPDKPITRRTRFRAASVSKMFTAFGIMKLVEFGKINLEDDAGKYLGFELRNSKCRRKKITVRSLANHTSTLRDGKIYSIPPDLSVEEFFKPSGKFWEDGAHFASSEGFCYSNLNYGLLGTIIETVTDTRFDIWQRENILKQLEIKAEYLPGNFAPEEFEQLGAIYRKKNSQGVWNEFGEWFSQIDDYDFQPAENSVSLQNPYDEKFNRTYDLSGYRIGTNATIFSPQGGLRISFEELAHSLEMLMNGGTFRGQKILSRESVAEMMKFNLKGGEDCGVPSSYGLGIYFVDGEGKYRFGKDCAINFIGHAGAAFGLLSGVFFIPSTKSGFVYMLNGEALEEEIDLRSHGKFSNNYIWEEKILDAICKFFVTFAYSH
jgi:D-alanyl-D-alanine carboxypeptidase